MTIYDESVLLTDQVDQILREYPTDSFTRHWNIYKENYATLDWTDCYIKVIPQKRYVNVALLGNGFLIDIDGEEGEPSIIREGLAIVPLDTISTVMVRGRGMPDVEELRDSTLVVTTVISGSNQQGPFWMADNEEEEASLFRFVRALIEKTILKGKS